MCCFESGVIMALYKLKKKVQGNTFVIMPYWANRMCQVVILHKPAFMQGCNLTRLPEKNSGFLVFFKYLIHIGIGILNEDIDIIR